MPKNKNKFVRVALEGATVDGRTISREQIQQMADNYDSKDNYGARIWMEHFRSLYPQSEFKAYGDVLALKAEENDAGKLGLFAQIDPTDSLIAINKDRQKVYTSIEVDPNFAGTGEAYMVGLAVTDSPASTGVEMLKFSLTSDKFTTKSHLYSEAIECDLDQFIEDDKTDNASSLFSKVTALFSKKDRSDEQRFNDVDQSVLQIAEETVNLSTQLKQSNSELDALKTAFNTLKDQLENQEGQHFEKRGLGAGYDTEHHNSNDVRTDC